MSGIQYCRPAPSPLITEWGISQGLVAKWDYKSRYSCCIIQIEGGYASPAGQSRAFCITLIGSSVYGHPTWVQQKVQPMSKCGLKSL